jgi:hypothetical protein
MTFGRTIVATSASNQEVTIQNEGSAPITFSGFAITGLGAGDFAIASNNCGLILAPGNGCSVAVSFTPTAAGDRSASLLIVTDAAVSPQSISLFGTGHGPAAQFVRGGRSLNFGNVTVGEAASPAVIQIDSSVGAAFDLDSFALGGTNASEFSIDRNDCAAAASGSDSGGGGYCSLYVKFAPAGAGLRVGYLRITNFGATQIVNLYGTGQ